MATGGEKMQRLYVHIGAPKCASSSIQRFLFGNSGLLEHLGFVMPDENLEFGKVPQNPLWFIQSLINDKPPGAAELVARRLRGTAGRTGLVTAENLGNPRAAPLFAEAGRHLDIRLLYVVRRQDDWILSSWKQWGSKIGHSLDDHITISLRSGRPEFGKTLAAWQEVVPSANVTVVSLDLLGPETSIELETLKWLGIERHFPKFRMEPGRANESFDFRISDLVSRHAGICRNAHDRRIDELLSKYSQLAGKRQFRLSEDVGARIMAAFRDENEALLGKEAAERLHAAPPSHREPARPGIDESGHDFILACLLEAMSNMSEELADLRKKVALLSPLAKGR